MPEESTAGESTAGEPTSNWTPLFDTGSIAAQPITGTDAPDEQSAPIPAFGPPEVVAGSYQYLKRWTFALVVAGVWIVAAVVGMALYHWWFQSIDKTGPVFVVLVYLVVCMLAGLIVAMIGNKPLKVALAIALMSAPLASTAAASVLYGAYVFAWFGR